MSQQQENLPSSEPSSFLLVGNVDDDANFANAIKKGHTANNQPIVAGETHMVLLTRSRFFVDLLSFNASPETISKMHTGEDLLQDPELWLKMQSQCKVDVPRQDVFVGPLQVRTYADFVSKTKSLLEEAVKLQSSGKSDAEIKKLQQQLEAQQEAEKQQQQNQKQGWIGWGVNLGLRTMTLGLVGTSTFTGGANNNNASSYNKNQQIANLSLCSATGIENAFRMAIACSQQGALAIMLDGISAQFSGFDDVNVGEVSDTDVLPPSAPTRRSCVAVKLIGSNKNIPVLEVRKLLRLFRVLANGTASTMMFVHTLLTVPLTPEGKHEVCLEWKVTLPPVPQLPEPKNNQQQQTKQKPVVVEQPVPVPLILAEQIPEAVATSRVLNDEELARQLQLQFDSEEKRVKDEMMKRDQELAKALAENPPEGGITTTNNNDDEGTEQTLLEEAVNARRKRGGGRRGGRKEPEQQPQQNSSRTCQCLGASAGFHKPSCEFAQRA